MFVVTADQRRSTREGVRVPELLRALEPWAARAGEDVVLGLERTVGDEVQTVLAAPEAVIDLARELMRNGEWSVGIGAGAVDLPLGDSARASAGPAFVHARRAVERARGRGEPVPLVVEGDDPAAAAHATAVMQLLASVIRRRSAAGWEVADALARGASQVEAAAALGISPQAVSQRADAALLVEERGVVPVTASLLRGAESAPSATVDVP